jgi:hypothetical protein
MEAPDPERTFEIGSMPVAVYGAMFAATVAGNFAGILADAALGVHGRVSLLMPIVFALVLEAAAGERAARQMAGKRLDAPRAAARVSLTYSLLLAAVSTPIAAWILGTRGHPPVPGSAGAGASVAARAVVLLAGAVFALAGLTVARSGLMRALARGRP